MFRHATRTQKSNILSLLHRILLSYTSVSDANKDPNTAPAYVTRFLRRILSALGAESRAPSPGPGPVEVEGGGNGNDGGLVEITEEPYNFFAEMGLVSPAREDGWYWLIWIDNRRSLYSFLNMWRRLKERMISIG
jgi:hypothetical protein